MSNIITNPKYKGYFVGGKVKVVDIFNKRQKYLPEDQWLMYKDEDGDTVPALVSEELWQKANEVFERRSIDVKNRRNCSTHKNIYTGKLFCTEDGSPYYCKDVHYKGNNYGKWLCSNKIKNGADSCRSIALYESELNPVILEVFREFSKSSEEILEAYLEQYRKVMADNAHIDEDRNRVVRDICNIENKQDQLLDMKVEGVITLDEFKRMMDKTREHKAKLEKELDQMANWEAIAEQMNDQSERIKKALSYKLDGLDDGMITRDFVDTFIRRIEVTPIDDTRVALKIHLLTNEIMQSELQKIKGRTGQQSKKMVEAYEKNL